MYKNALKEDPIRVVEDLDGTVESTDTIAKLRTVVHLNVQTPSEEIITLSSCFGEQRMVEVKPINLSLDPHFPGLSVRTAISPTLTEEFIIHPSVYAEIKKLGHAKSDVLLSESGSSLGVHFNSNVSVSILCKTVNGAMKTSSVEFISRSPTPSPMERNYRRFVLLRRIFEPWQWKRRKREIVLNRRPEL
ncbi:hypothetical protein TNCV_3055701 [Trichonephila clavipes]|nr:hypothetical protein TNCV_3055701 [Trichonephila clavipes]